MDAQLQQVLNEARQRAAQAIEAQRQAQIAVTLAVKQAEVAEGEAAVVEAAMIHEQAIQAVDVARAEKTRLESIKVKREAEIKAAETALENARRLLREASRPYSQAEKLLDSLMLEEVSKAEFKAQTEEVLRVCRDELAELQPVPTIPTPALTPVAPQSQDKLSWLERQWGGKVICSKCGHKTKEGIYCEECGGEL